MWCVFTKSNADLKPLIVSTSPCKSSPILFKSTFRESHLNSIDIASCFMFVRLLANCSSFFRLRLSVSIESFLNFGLGIKISPLVIVAQYDLIDFFFMTRTSSFSKRLKFNDKTSNCNDSLKRFSSSTSKAQFITC